jgi:hypothetical protein
MRRTPGLAAAVILTLALGIGATATILGVVYGVLSRPHPSREPSPARFGSALAQRDATGSNE